MAKARKPRSYELYFPAGGLNRRAGYQSQPPYTTPDALNVRPFDPIEGRERGGSRPGLVKSFETQFGGGEPIQAMAAVTVADDNGDIRDVLMVVAGGIIRYTDEDGDLTTAPYLNEVVVDSETLNGGFEDVTSDAVTLSTSFSEIYRESDVVYAKTSAAHGFQTGDVLTVSGLTEDSDLNETDVTITVVDDDEFSYPSTGDDSGVAPVDATRCWIERDGDEIAISSLTHSGVYAYFTTSSAHGLSLYDWVMIRGCTNNCSTTYPNKVYEILSSTEFRVSTGDYGTYGPTSQAGATVTPVRSYGPPGYSSFSAFYGQKFWRSSNVVTATMYSHGLTTGDTITVYSYSAGYDQFEASSVSVTVVDSDTITYACSGDNIPWVGTGGSIKVDGFDDWTESGFVRISEDPAETGDYAATLQYVNAEVYVYKDVSVTAEEDYFYSFSALGDGINAGQYRIYDNTNSADIVAKTSTGVTDSEEWSQVSGEFTAPAGCTSIRIYLYSPSSEGVAYADNVSLIHRVAATGEMVSGTTVPVIGMGQKFFMADARENVSGTAGVVASSVLSDAAISDWTTLDIDTDKDVVAIAAVSGGFTGGTYDIASVAAGGITLDTAAVPDDTDYVYQVGRRIQYLNPETGTIGPLIATEGQSPLNCRILCNYRGRLTAIFKNTWYQARQNDPFDWDYGADEQDGGRAMAGGVADAADIPDPVVAAVPHTDDFLLFFCSHSTWIMRGDAALGAGVDPISHRVGIVGREAWCKLPGGVLMFLSSAGLYLLEAGGNGYPIPFSDEVLPDELKNVDGNANAVTMEYDAVNDGAHLFIVPTDGTAGSHWWVSWRNKSVWPVSLPLAMQPYSMLVYSADSSEDRRVLLGGADGHIREFDVSATTDDGITFDSYVQIGPFRMGEVGHDGILTRLIATLDEESGDVNYGIRVARTAEAAVHATTSKMSGVWEAGWNRPRISRVRGAAGSIYVEGTGDAWAIETVNMTLLPAGLIR